MTWPLFQSALTSTPFPGTYAEDSTPAPSDGTQQQELPYVPKANEAPGASGDQARAEKLKEQSVLDEAIASSAESIRYLENLRWSRHPNSNRWVRRQNLGLNGNKDVEPPEMMYARMKAISEHGRVLQTLLEEKRLANQPSPGEVQTEQEIAKLTVHSIEVMDRRRRVTETNATLRAMGLPEIPPDKALAFSENPTTNLSGGGDPEDILKRIKAAQEVGQQATAEGITHLPLSAQGPAEDARKAAEKARAEKKKSDADSTKYAGYHDLKSLRVALNAAYDRYADTLETEVEGVGMVVNPSTFQREKGVVIRKELTPEAARKARQMALDQFDGAETIPELQNYVEGKGAPPPEQKDLTPAQQTKKLLDARKAKAK